MKTTRQRFTTKEQAKKKVPPFFSPATIQPKLTVNAPNDKYEQQADAMADRVMRISDQDEEQVQMKPLAEGIQRKCAARDEEAQREPIMRKAQGGGFEAPANVSRELQSSKGNGAQLNSGTLQRMNKGFGADFSHVKVHTDARAQRMSQNIQAKAFTHGSDIYFNRGAYKPGSSGGDRLLAHELTHVVQQGGGSSKTVQRNGKDEKGSSSKTKIEVVHEQDLIKGKGKTKGKTTRTGDEKISEGLTAKASETTTGETRKTTAAIEAKHKKSGLFAQGTVGATESFDPAVADNGTGAIKLGGKWTPLDNDGAKFDLGTSFTLASDSAPKFSVDGKVVFFPKASIRPEIIASVVGSHKGYKAEATTQLTWELSKVLSLKAGVTGAYDSVDGKSLTGKAGVAISF